MTFKSQIPNDSPLWGGMNPDMLGILSTFGGGTTSAGAPTSGFDLDSITDPWQRFQAETMLKSQEMQGQSLEVLRQQQQPLSGFAKGAQTFGTITQGLGSLYNIYAGLQGLKLQKEAFNFNKGVTNTNLNNSIMDYNRRLTDTLTNRALNNGQGQSWISDQLARYSAKRS